MREGEGEPVGYEGGNAEMRPLDGGGWKGNQRDMKEGTREEEREPVGHEGGNAEMRKGNRRDMKEGMRK